MELTTFRLREGIDEAAFRSADEAAQAFHHLQPGILRRTTMRAVGDGDGDWAVAVLWASWEHADAAAEAARADAAMQAYDAMIDPGSVHVRRFDAFDEMAKG